MKKEILAALATIMAGAIIAAAQAPGQASGGTAGPAAGRASTRVSWRLRTMVGDQAYLGWRLGIPANAFPGLALSEAAARVDGLGLAYIGGSSAQWVSPEIRKNLDYNLTPGEIAAARNNLRAFNLQMLAYHVNTIGPDDAARRKLFEFAKALGVETIVSAPPPASLAALDKLASEFGVDLAIENRSRKETPAYWDPKSLLSAIEGRSKHIGVCADIGYWIREGIKPSDALAQLKDRVKAVNLQDRTAAGAAGRDVTLGYGVAGMTQLFQQMYKLGLKPLFLTLNTTGAPDAYTDLSRSIDGFEDTVQPVIGAHVIMMSKKTPIRGPDELTPEVKQKIAAAIPRQAPAKPMKPRKLLVLDLCIGNGSHDTIPNGTYALELLGKYTGAYEAVFSNDLDNLKYDKIRQFDAVFMNDSLGIILSDPGVRDGLLRFVREGGGLGGLHGASYGGAKDWPEFMEMFGAGMGPHRIQRATWKIDDPASPLTKAFGGQPFTYTDEYYRFFDTGPHAQFFSREKVHVLFSVDMAQTPDFNDGRVPFVRKDNDYAISFIKGYGKGRVYNCSLGHMPDLFMQPKLNEHFLAAIQFILGDLPADTTPSAELPARE